MDDVHMEEAGAATPGQGNHQQQPSTAPGSAATAALQVTSPTHPPAGEAGAAPASQREHSSSNTANTPSPTLAGVAVHHAASSHEKSESREDSSGMDIDASTSDHVKTENTNEHSNDIVKANSNSVEHGDARSPSRPAVIQPAAPDSSATSAATVATQVHPASGSAEAERTSTADIEKKVTTAPAPPTDAVEMAASTAEVSQAANPESSPAPPIRTYTPQFKFTTFTAMAPLPTRNVTSNFLKTDKNYVLKDMSERQRRRKRKAGDQDSTAGLAMADEAEAEVQDKENSESAEGADEGSALLLKKKRNDELSAIRKGIFADDDLDLEDETMSKKDQDEDDEGLYSSESDSEASVVNEMDENGETKSASLFGTTSNAGKKIIVIHPGSRVLRIGRASDAYPVVTPHCIARRMKPVAPSGSSAKGRDTSSMATGGAVSSVATDAAAGAEASEQQTAVGSMAEDDGAMEIDGEETQNMDESDAVNDRYLKEIEYDLKLRMKAAKRRPVPNAKTQVRSFNTSTRPEKILDHNDPYKVEWTDPAAEGEFIIGQKALNLPTGAHHTFKLFWPIVGGKFNEQDYATPRVVVSDLETIWTKVIQEDLNIDPKTFRKHYALLIIPDLYSKLYVLELVGMLLNSMQFRGVMVQQESVCASFGAGVSAACVVDIGAEVTKVACVEDGICIPNSRAMLKYGGDDITRVFTALVKRTGFPYQELDLAQTYDWRLMEELKEKWCTMNEADLTVQVYSFFVRKPEKQTEKYQVKVYDEVALSPMCLFFPGVIRRWIEQREPKPSFAKVTNYEDINEDAPPISLVNQSSKKNAAAAAVAAAARAGTPSLTTPGEEASNINNSNSNGVNGGSNAGTPNPGVSSAAATPAQTPAPSGPSLTVPGAATGISMPVESAVDVVIPFAMEPLVRTTDKSWEVAGTIGKDDFSSLVALDIVVAQSISNCGSEERSKKLYGSIILVGGGGMVKGFDRVLEDRLFQALPATLTTVEKVEVLPSPREMDPRLLVWKGGSVLGKLESSKELWIKPLEWALQGRRVLRDKALFVWSKD
ncbi:actin-like protein arp8 [Mortierella alpina]|nr:actin-like protein arp8 [Mortierella alpina]